MAEEFILFAGACAPCPGPRPHTCAGAECLFSQRVWITLLEKGVRFQFRRVPLRHPTDNRLLKPAEKPPDLIQYNPSGKVRVHTGA